MYDPDASKGRGWWHWVVFDIPKTASGVLSNASKLNLLPKGSIESLTNFGVSGFGGACPPKGDSDHRYIITVYALDISSLKLDKNAKPALVRKMLNAHAIEKSSIISYFGRK